MSKLKLSHGVSRVRRAKLQVSIDQTVADDLELMAKWSNNETQYIVNELLRFAIAQEEDFLKFKAATTEQPSKPSRPTPVSAKPVSEAASKNDPSSASVAHQ